MESWKFRKMRRTKSRRWILKTATKTHENELAAMGIERLKGDQQALFEIASKASSPSTQCAAIELISDAEFIDSIAGGPYTAKTREAAIRKSLNQPLLRKLAIYEMDLYAAAVETLTDETLLAEVAKHAAWEKAGVLAFRKLTDEALRQSVCGEDVPSPRRLQAAIEMGDQSRIARYVMNPHTTHATDWFIAVKNCTDLVLLETQLQDERLTFPQKEFLYRRLGRNEEAVHAKLRNEHIIFDTMKLLDQITNPDLLMDLVKNTSDWYLRPEAAKKLVKSDFPNKTEWMRDAAMHDCSIGVRIAAYEGLPECNREAVRLHGELSDADYGVRERAAQALMDLFEHDKLALAVLGRDASRLIEEPHNSYDTLALDECSWNGGHIDEPASHSDTGIGLKFREYEGFNLCD